VQGRAPERGVLASLQPRLVPYCPPGDRTVRQGSGGAAPIVGIDPAVVPAQAPVVKAAVVIGLACTFVGCAPEASPSPSLRPGEFALRTPEPQNGMLLCAGGGFVDRAVLHGSPNFPGITWIAFEPPGRRETVLWPPGFRATFRPELEVLNAAGQVVVREGAIATSGGWVSSDGMLITIPGVDLSWPQVGS
jgi:hypothetical protein